MTSLFPGALLLASALFVAFPAESQPVAALEVEPATIQIGAVQAIGAGDFALARTLSDALLSRDAGDLIALTVRAQSSFALGDYATARAAASQLYLSDIPPERRYQAARLAALSALNEDRPTLSGLWLRLALIVAPTEEEAARTREDAAGVRRNNPWSTSVELSFQPSNNVNGGAQTSAFEIDGIELPGFLTDGTISRAGQALSGWTGSVDLRTSYRFQQNEASRTSAGLRLRFQAARLSDDARRYLDSGSAADRAFDDGDLTSALLEFRISHDRAAERGIVTLEAALGAAWTQGDYAYSFARLSGSRIYALTETDALRGSLFYERRIETTERYDDSTRYGLQASWIHSFATGSRLTSSLGYTITDSPDPQLAQDAKIAAFSFSPAQPVGPATMTFSLGAEQTLVPDYRFFGAPIPGGREDLRYFATVDAFFPDYDFAGFAPVVTLDLSTTDSNVSRFDREDYGIGVNFRSTF